MRVVNRIEFTARDDAEAMRLAAERLGKDAVILSTQMVKEGGIMGLFQRTVMKVTAGILEDDSKEPQPKPKPKDPRGDEDTRRETLIGFQKLMELKDRTAKGRGPLPGGGRPLTPARGQAGNIAMTPTGGEGYLPSVADSPDGDTVRISSEGLRNAYGLSPAPQQGAIRPAAVRPAPAPMRMQPFDAPQQDETKVLKDQVGALAQRVESLLERLAVVEGEPLPAGVPQRAGAASAFQAGLPAQDAAFITSQGPGPLPGALNERGLEGRLRSSEVDEKYIRKLLADYGVTDRRTPFTEWLGSRIECAGDNGGDASGGRKVMLLGPTGVGKTTTIAKLAAIQALWEHKKVLLLTSDTYRIAAVDQLKTYAKILNVPIEIVFDADSIPSLLEEHESADIVLLDTAGRAQRDKKSLEVFESLYDAFIPDAVHLCLAANMKYNDMLDVIEHIPNIPVSHLIFTKLDETISYGAIFNIQQVMGCPVSFLTAGQNVPKDIETASGSRIAEFLMMTEEERKRG